MTRVEEIQQKAKELAQQWFPDENNIWARENFEAQAVEAACMEICKWADQTMLDKVCEWLVENIKNYSTNALGAEYLVDDLRKAMQDV